MRELFFRGKRVDNGEWAEGDGIQRPKSDKRKGTCWIGGMESDSDWAEVVPETVGQYTGLTDKNGKKMFDGDIIRMSDSEETFYVTWGKYNELSWQVRSIKYKQYLHRLEDENPEKYEVVGNIYDDLNLLTGFNLYFADIIMAFLLLSCTEDIEKIIKKFENDNDNKEKINSVENNLSTDVEHGYYYTLTGQKYEGTAHVTEGIGLHDGRGNLLCWK